jgi:hypothetical protein
MEEIDTAMLEAGAVAVWRRPSVQREDEEERGDGHRPPAVVACWGVEELRWRIPECGMGWRFGKCVRVRPRWCGGLLAGHGGH